MMNLTDAFGVTVELGDKLILSTAKGIRKGRLWKVTYVRRFGEVKRTLHVMVNEADGNKTRYASVFTTAPFFKDPS
jgi:hypothetical protein